ncbi:hypothetical protein HK100_005435 [Physocladia obscura]|uniref:Uncharacterized protein n=1 Tax=Physocladia obscura TaxID=109957 RepID=A0AAD5SRM3_9FUNG|nr:hypothetical protein HK100_005435 [Physocladia obscura]
MLQTDTVLPKELNTKVKSRKALHPIRSIRSLPPACNDFDKDQMGIVKLDVFSLYVKSPYKLLSPQFQIQLQFQAAVEAAEASRKQQQEKQQTKQHQQQQQNRKLQQNSLELKQSDDLIVQLTGTRSSARLMRERQKESQKKQQVSIPLSPMLNLRPISSMQYSSTKITAVSASISNNLNTMKRALSRSPASSVPNSMDEEHDHDIDDEADENEEEENENADRDEDDSASFSNLTYNRKNRNSKKKSKNMIDVDKKLIAEYGPFTRDSLPRSSKFKNATGGNIRGLFLVINMSNTGASTSSFYVKKVNKNTVGGASGSSRLIKKR